MIGTSLLFSGSIGGLISPFDTITPTAGYSLRNLSLSYNGDVVLVRRDSDSAFQAFKANEITNGTLSNYLTTLGSSTHSQEVTNDLEPDVSLVCSCDSGSAGVLEAQDVLYIDGFVFAWYDQFGTNHAVQTSAASQPKIWDASTGLVTKNGKPALDFDGTNCLSTPDYIVQLSANNATVFAVRSVTSVANGEYLLTEGDVESPYSSNFILGSSDGDLVLWVNTTEFGTVTVAKQDLLSFTYDGTDFQAYLNGTASGSAGSETVNSEVFNRTAIGASADLSTGFFTGKIQEIITYKSDQSANRTDIEDNINDYYDIY